MQTSRMFCYNCYTKRPVHFEDRPVTFNIRGDSVTINGRLPICSKCGEVVSHPEIDDENFLKAYSEYRRKNGFLEPKEIASIRSQYGLSQRALARLLGWGPITIQRYERGSLQSRSHNHLLKLVRDDPDFVLQLMENSSCKLSEKEKAEIRETIRDSGNPAVEDEIPRVIEQGLRRENPSEYTGYGTPDVERLANMALFFARESKLPLFKVKLLKELFYADFLHFATHNVSISGFRYARLPMGPVPDGFQTVLAWMEQMKLAEIQEVWLGRNRYPGEALIPLRPFDERIFTSSEIETLKRVSKKFARFSGARLAKLTHREPAWQNTKQTSLISYRWAKQLRALTPTR